MDITLVISSQGVKLVSVQKNKVLNWGYASFNGEVVKDGQIINPDSVAATITELFKKTNISPKKVIMTVIGLPFVYRTIELPVMKSELVPEAILRAAKSEIPLSVNDMYLSWQDIIRGEKEVTYFLAGVDRHCVDTLTGTMKKAGIKYWKLDLCPLSLARAACRRDAIIMSLEPGQIDIVLLINGLVSTIHTSPYENKGSNSQNGERRFVEELIKTINYYNTNHPEAPIPQTTPLLLTGELTSNASILENIRNEVEYPVETLVPPLESQPGLPVESYVANMGLAMGIPGSDRLPGQEACQNIALDILQGKFDVKPQTIRLPYIVAPALLAIIIGIFLPVQTAVGQINWEAENMLAKLNTAKQQVLLARQTYNNAVNEQKKIDEQTQEVRNKIDNLKKEKQMLLDNGGNFASTLSLTNRNIPEGLLVDQVEISKVIVDKVSKLRMVVDGFVPEKATVIDYVAKLESTGGFNVRIVELGREVSDSGVSYKIELVAK